MEHHKPIDQDDEYDYLFKIVLIGDAGVGKTCIVQRFRSGTFIERHGSTIGVDFTMKTLHLDGKRIKVSIPKLEIRTGCQPLCSFLSIGAIYRCRGMVRSQRYSRSPVD